MSPVAEPTTVRVTVNGAARAFPAGTPLAEVVAAVSDRPGGIAVALNGDVVARGRWAGTAVADGDEVEVVTAMQGG